MARSASPHLMEECATYSRERGAERLRQAIDEVGRIVLGKEAVIRTAVACLLARGHLLIEDIPGVGKTLLAHALARVLGLAYQRVQFTSDLLPADILGVSVFERSRGEFRFHPGPVFAQVVLADEINRAPPKTQSALLEAMEERQVTVEGETRALPVPFFVVATQNPQHQVGTFPLPESQLDRFLMCLSLGYPDREAERMLYRGGDRRELLRELTPCLTAGEVLAAQAAVSEIHLSESLLDYAQALVRHTRTAPECSRGLSPRAGVGLLRSAQTWALLEGRNYTLPEDVQAVFPAVAGHRLGLHRPLHTEGNRKGIQPLLESVPVP